MEILVLLWFGTDEAQQSDRAMETTAQESKEMLKEQRAHEAQPAACPKLLREGILSLHSFGLLKM